MDRRNFGTAQTALKQASDGLEKADFQSAGLAAVQVQSVKDALKAIDLAVSSETGTARDQILKAAESMDAMLDSLPAMSPSVTTAPTDSTSQTPDAPN